MNLRFAGANGGKLRREVRVQNRSEATAFNVETHNSSPSSRFAPVLNVTQSIFGRVTTAQGSQEGNRRRLVSMECNFF